MAGPDLFSFSSPAAPQNGGGNGGSAAAPETPLVPEVAEPAFDILSDHFLNALAALRDPSSLGDLGILAGLAALAGLLGFAVARWVRRRYGLEKGQIIGDSRRLAHTATTLIFPVTFFLLVFLASSVQTRLSDSAEIFNIALSLLGAWMVIRMAVMLVRNPSLARLVAVVAWTVAALNILDLLGPTTRFLDSIGLRLGDFYISLFGIIKGVLILAAALWAATLASRLVEHQLTRSTLLSPSSQALFAKLLRIVLITVAVVVAISAVGIDLMAFTVFSGAVGLGLGFGLQKIFANLISGIIILAEKSIKPGDVIGIQEKFGWVNSLGARYVSLITRDGIEHLIPNEDFITQRVENWSFSHQNVRLKIAVGIHYKSDVNKAIALCIEAAKEVERVLENPPPICLLVGFGDSSVDLEIRFWINDPPKGVSNVKSAVLLKVWEKFHEHEIEIPYPQRDLHLRTPEAVRIVTENQIDGG